MEKLISIPWLHLFHHTKDQPENLPQTLKTFGIDAHLLSLLASAAEHAGEAYGRRVLYKSNEIEVMLASWSFQSMASPHNHGASQGLIWFARGNFFEQHYRFEQRALNEFETPAYYLENHVVSIDATDIHSCCPESTGLSLHIYSPPIHRMKVWDLEHKRTLIVDDNCGAWVPVDQSLIVKEMAW